MYFGLVLHVQNTMALNGLRFSLRQKDTILNYEKNLNGLRSVQKLVSVLNI